jgi:hypothetical protein
MEGGIEGAFFHGENFVGTPLDALDDGVTVKRAGVEGLENEEVQGALEQFSFRVLHSL